MRWHLSLGFIILLIASVFAGGIVAVSGSLNHKDITPGTPAVHANSSANGTVRHVVLSKKSEQKVPDTKPAELRNTSAPSAHEGNTTLLSTSTLAFQYTRQNLSAEVTNPPFVIDLSIVPKEVIDAKWYVNRTLSKHDEITQVTRPSEGAFLEMTVFDVNTGKLVAHDGFGRDYSIDQHRTIEIYEPGKYLVNLYGNAVTVRSVLSMKKPESPGSLQAV